MSVASEERITIQTICTSISGCVCQVEWWVGGLLKNWEMGANLDVFGGHSGLSPGRAVGAAGGTGHCKEVAQGHP